MTSPDRIQVGLGCAVFAYWAVFHVFTFGDLYLSRPSEALFLKALLPVAVAVNLAGLATTIANFTVQRKGWKIAALTLHGIPLATSIDSLRDLKDRFASNKEQTGDQLRQLFNVLDDYEKKLETIRARQEEWAPTVSSYKWQFDSKKLQERLDALEEDFKAMMEANFGRESHVDERLDSINKVLREQQDPLDALQAHRESMEQPSPNEEALEIEASKTSEEARETASPSIQKDTDREALEERIKKMHDEGLSNQQTADRLNEEGVPTISGTGKWHKKSIYRILKRLSKNS